MENAFNERGVSVTRNGLSCAGLVFPLREIRDLNVVTVNKNAVVPILISLIGVAAIAAGAVYAVSGGIVVGAMLAVVGYLTWITQDVTYRLMVDTAEGKREAVVSVEREFVERVAQVVRDAKAAQPAATAAAAK
ncbi:DUF6232 family protein [Burkholderia gladioli]|uniref:Holin n=1 Tax=Burkholderia gladioli TaxID=28095 RepID=A0AAW3EY47_BURGA|nr:DUF6232 family protein [Burkholderia gladioli]AJW95096.1 hypothetical protein BM43_6576 [Burkholderia gladioli]ASD83633.1 hypothetical protein CEJ98_32835 [Burkholderia gladioli pv. gladioli]ATF89053.1 hypothetical protein CO712_29230 [Burkholderia gladioli pv. gladioli]AWY51060.1 hypothetical protein A8H28_07605 [Burkholderia gladioli pv. gladioli]KGC13001.1 hypothetical protein DM48_1191 [Burkholderia gladioli]